MPGLKDELGDLLFQVVFHARMAEEAGLFAFDDVAAAIADKMVRRHPHVFGTTQIASAEAQTGAWEEQKAKERWAQAAATGSAKACSMGWRSPSLPCCGPPRSSGARRGSGSTGQRRARSSPKSPRKSPSSRSNSITRGRRSEKIEDEMGDVLFAAANLARKLGIEPEAALRRATAKFERRFRAIEALAAARGVGADLDVSTRCGTRSNAARADELARPEPRSRSGRRLQLLPAPRLVVDQAAGETRRRTDTGAETRIAGDGANDRAAAGADCGARQRSLLSRGHVGQVASGTDATTAAKISRFIATSVSRPPTPDRDTSRRDR